VDVTSVKVPLQQREDIKKHLLLLSESRSMEQSASTRCFLPERRWSLNRL